MYKSEAERDVPIGMECRVVVVAGGEKKSSQPPLDGGRSCGSVDEEACVHAGRLGADHAVIHLHHLIVDAESAKVNAAGWRVLLLLLAGLRVLGRSHPINGATGGSAPEHAVEVPESVLVEHAHHAGALELEANGGHAQLAVGGHEDARVLTTRDAPAHAVQQRALQGTGRLLARGLVHSPHDLAAATGSKGPVLHGLEKVEDRLDLLVPLGDTGGVPLPKDADEGNHGGLVEEPDGVPTRHLVARPLTRNVLDGLLGQLAARLDGGKVLLSGHVEHAAGAADAGHAAGHAQEHGAVEQHAKILVAPLHDAARDVQGLGARVRRAQEPGKVTVPVDELAVKVAPVLSAEEGRDRQHVLDLRGDLAELDVLNERQDTCMLSRVAGLVGSVSLADPGKLQIMPEGGGEGGKHIVVCGSPPPPSDGGGKVRRRLTWLMPNSGGLMLMAGLKRPNEGRPSVVVAQVSRQKRLHQVRRLVSAATMSLELWARLSL